MISFSISIRSPTVRPLTLLSNSVVSPAAQAVPPPPDPDVSIL